MNSRAQQGFPVPSCPFSPLSSCALGCSIPPCHALSCIPGGTAPLQLPGPGSSGQQMFLAGGRSRAGLLLSSDHPSRARQALPSAAPRLPRTACGSRRPEEPPQDRGHPQPQRVPRSDCSKNPSPKSLCVCKARRQQRGKDPAPCLKLQGHVLVACSGCKPGMPAGRSIQPKPHPCLAPGHSRGGLGGCTALRD